MSRNNPYNLRNAHRSRSKQVVLDIAAERHLLEVAYYSQNGNAVRMWGKPHVKEQLAEYKHYLAAQAA